MDRKIVKCCRVGILLYLFNLFMDGNGKKREKQNPERKPNTAQLKMLQARFD
jgi:hypothetical protein